MSGEGSHCFMPVLVEILWEFFVSPYVTLLNSMDGDSSYSYSILPKAIIVYEPIFLIKRRGMKQNYLEVISVTGYFYLALGTPPCFCYMLGNRIGCLPQG